MITQQFSQCLKCRPYIASFAFAITHMSTYQTSEDWPACELQQLDSCPICASSDVKLLHQHVRDWSFNCAPGDWSYWRCEHCATVFLNPRPSSESIGRAYQTYYTHDRHRSQLAASLKARWKNTRLSERFQRDIRPRLPVPKPLRAWLARKATSMALPFGIDELASRQPGTLMDVGCGSGKVLGLAQQLGWTVRGLELDPQAVEAARTRGLEVFPGGYERLSEFPNQFDVIMCSHVIEHVFDPVQMINLLHAALRPGGVLYLSTPNSESDVHAAYGKHWRGLEAPRHLVLFSQATLIALLVEADFRVTNRSTMVLQTVRESERIKRHGHRVSSTDRAQAKRVSLNLSRTGMGQDFIEIVAIKDDRSMRN